MTPRLLLVVSALAGSGILLLPLAARAAPEKSGAPQGVFPYAIHETVLENGLRVVAVPMDSPGLAAHYLVVRAGSRNEVEPGLSGFAHFFEHMMFRGTERYPAERYNAVLKKLGADSNAFTTDDWTCYHITSSSEALGTVMEIESDRFMNLKYGLEAFQKEAGAVLGEYNKNYSMPLMTLFEKTRDTAYTAHTYKHTTMGFLKDIEDMPNQYDYSLKFFDRWYRPDNCALVVAGDVDPAKVFDLARRHYGPWKSGSAALTVPQEPPQTREKKAHIPWANPTLPYLVVAYHGSAFDPDSVDGRSLDVLSEAAFSETSPLYQDLVLDKQWVESISGRLPDRRDSALFIVLARIKDPSRVEAVRDAIYATLERLAVEPLAPERLAAVKSRIRYAFLQSLDTPDRVAVTVGNFLQLTGQSGSIDRTFAAYEGVTPETVKQVAARTFRPENRTVVTLAHAEGGKP